jgi:hypothetical protein
MELLQLTDSNDLVVLVKKKSKALVFIQARICFPSLLLAIDGSMGRPNMSTLSEFRSRYRAFQQFRKNL